MRCPKCGTESPDQARFCRSCGERFSSVDEGAHAPRLLTPEERSRRLLEDAFRLSEEGKLQTAIHACQQAISLNPTSTSAHSLLGTLCERVGDRDGAIRAYEQVLTLSPGSTVERRRLNELMGVAAAEQVAVSPRTARMAVTGGFVVIAVVLLAAIVLTTQQPEPTRRPAPRRQASIERTTAAPSAVTATELAPPRLIGSGRIRAPRFTPAIRPSQPRAQVRAPASQGFAQYLGPGTFQLPVGAPRATTDVTVQRWAPRGYETPPIRGAVPMRSGVGPVVKTPQWRYPSSIGATQTGNPRLARNYYFQGQYRQAIDSYRGYLSQNPQAPEPREELAWVYSEAGDYRSAQDEYRTALGQYESDIDRGHNVVAAQHGVRTCESAIKALETK